MENYILLLVASIDDQKRRVKFVFELYAGGGVIDGFDIIDAVYGLQLNPTRALVKSIVNVEKRREKYYTYDEFWDIYVTLKENKDQGGFHDFVECLKNFDMAENGTMKLIDLTHMLRSLGETVTEKELNSVMKECLLEEDDDDGYFPYMPFLCRLCDEPVPKGFKPSKASKLVYS